MSSFKAKRNFDMSSFGWTGCTFTFNALTWGEMRKLETAQKEWQTGDTEKAANEIVDLLKSKFVTGEALDDNDKKFTVTTDDFENIPFDVFLKLVKWVTAGEVDDAFLAA